MTVQDVLKKWDMKLSIGCWFSRKNVRNRMNMLSAPDVLPVTQQNMIKHHYVCFIHNNLLI